MTEAIGKPYHECVEEHLPELLVEFGVVRHQDLGLIHRAGLQCLAAELQFDDGTRGIHYVDPWEMSRSKLANIRFALLLRWLREHRAWTKQGPRAAAGGGRG